jgi:hypothetical protein
MSGSKEEHASQEHASVPFEEDEQGALHGLLDLNKSERGGRRSKDGAHVSNWPWKLYAIVTLLNY